jgi:hypothetical protein
MKQHNTPLRAVIQCCITSRYSHTEYSWAAQQHHQFTAELQLEKSHNANSKHIPYVILTALVGKPEGKRPLGRPRRRWVDNIRMDLEEVGWGDVDWIGLAKDRNRWRTLVNSVSNLRVP